MKANEIEDGKVLMIGDLVIGCIETDIVGEATYEILCKVININHYGDVSCEALKPFPDELDWQDGDDFSWIEPIPLTAEILEKNGFTCDANGMNDSDEPVVSVEYGEYQRNTDDGFKMLADGKAIKYVHELQHALRLCGIEKTIEL